jgi:ribonuclease P protein component
MVCMGCEVAVNPAADRELPPGGEGQSFPRSGRLLRHADFERVYKQGRRHFASHMTVFYRDRGDAGGWRVGFTVGRALGGAVERNRIKRRLRESVRMCWPQRSLPADVVVNPKKSVLRTDFGVLVEEVRHAFGIIAQKLEPKPHRRLR